MSESEAEAFVRANPDIQEVDAFVIDVNGHALGKRLPVADLPRIYDSGVQFSACALILDVRGHGQGAAGLGSHDGDPDGNAWPVPGTLKRAPWTLHPTAQVQLAMRDCRENRPLLVGPARDSAQCRRPLPR